MSVGRDPDTWVGRVETFPEAVDEIEEMYKEAKDETLRRKHKDPGKRERARALSQALSILNHVEWPPTHLEDNHDG